MRVRCGPGRRAGPGGIPVIPAAGDAGAGRAAHPALPAPGIVRVRPGASGRLPAGRAGLARLDGPEPARPGCLPGHLPARAHRAVPGPDRRRGRRGGLDRVHPLLPAHRHGPGIRRDQADRRAGHRRAGGRVRRDHAARRPRRAEEIRARRLHRDVLAAIPGRPHPGGVPRLRDLAGLPRRGDLRPVRELLPPGMGAHRREPGMPGSRAIDSACSG